METLGMLRSFVCCCHRSQEGKLCSKWEVLLFAAGTIQDFPVCRGGEGSALIPFPGFPLCPGSSHPWLVLGWFGESKS